VCDYLERDNCMVLNWYSTLSIRYMIFTSCYHFGMDLFLLLLINILSKYKSESTQLECMLHWNFLVLAISCFLICKGII
jgi:hypothetical protein